MPTRPRRRPSAGRQSIDPDESQRAVAVTVAWMLTTMTTLVAQVAAAAVNAIAWFATESLALLAFGRLLLFAAAISGTVSLGLMVVACRIRRRPAPTSVAVASLAIAVVPLFAVVLLIIRG